MLKKVMTADELADYLQFNRSTIYKMARAGKIPAIKFENAWRFSKDAIDLWLKNRSVENFRGSLQENVGTLEDVEFRTFELHLRSDLSKKAFYGGQR